ncbi:MAG TPA: metal ABC transporter substrate-binding protein [Candidatus Saccharimonadales bacterium]|nr:metal ABC transporter substrate-binding protein [Candidatus Saccharimonadales bacterium]
MRSAAIRDTIRSDRSSSGRRRTNRAIVLIGLIAIGLSACSSSTGSGSSPPSTGRQVVVVTTTTVFADMVRQVGGDHVNVQSLVPANGDVHTFEPNPSDIQHVATAQLLVMNGLGLDDWLEKTLTNASASGTPLVKLGENLPGVDDITGEQANGPPNPHLWMNVAYAELYVDRIATALKQVDPSNAAAYDAGAAAYHQRLVDLDTYVRQQIQSIPPANRRVISFHDAFPYYARAYGLEIVGVAVEAPGQDPSAAYTARLIQAIRAAGVKAIFAEAQFPRKLVDQLAAETGASVVSDLYDDAIGDPPITTYEAIIRWDTDQFVKALK